MNQNKVMAEDNNMLIVDLGFSSVKFLRADKKGTVKGPRKNNLLN
jgi:hypothetical protein